MGIVGECRSDSGREASTCMVNYKFAVEDPTTHHYPCGVENDNAYCSTLEKQYCSAQGICTAPPSTNSSTTNTPAANTPTDSSQTTPSTTPANPSTASTENASTTTPTNPSTASNGDSQATQRRLEIKNESTLSHLKKNYKGKELRQRVKEWRERRLTSQIIATTFSQSNIRNSRFSLSAIPRECMPNTIQVQFGSHGGTCDSNGFYEGYDNLVDPLNEGENIIARMYQGLSADEMEIKYELYHCQAWPKLIADRKKA